MQIEATFSILTCFSMVFARNPTRPGKSKQTFQFWSVLEWCLQEIQLGYANRNRLFNFDPSLNGFCRKSYQTTQIEATFSILTRFWMVFARNPTRPCKSKQTFEFWPGFDKVFQEILPDHANRGNLSILIRFWMVFPRNMTRVRKSKQTFQFWPVFEWFL